MMRGYHESVFVWNQMASSFLFFEIRVALYVNTLAKITEVNKRRTHLGEAATKPKEAIYQNALESITLSK